MKNNALVIWRDINVKIKEKQIHVTKIGGKLKNSMINTYGDIPVCVLIKEITYDVVNPRGRAYAARRRMQYRKGRFLEQKNAVLS